jgi:hypothetical protein
LYRINCGTNRLFRKLDNIQDLVSRRFETLFTFLDAWSSDHTHPRKRDLGIRLESSLAHNTVDFIPADTSRASDLQNNPDPWSWVLEALTENEREEFKRVFTAKESGGTMAGGSSSYTWEMVQKAIGESEQAYRFKDSVSFIPSWVTDIPAWMTEKMRIAPEVRRYWRIVLRRMLAT